MEPKKTKSHKNEAELTVHHSRAVADYAMVQEGLLVSDAKAAHLFMRFTDECAQARGDEARLLDIISAYTFQAFPQTTHLVLATKVDARKLKTTMVRSREGKTPSVTMSKTLAKRAMDEKVAILFSEADQDQGDSESIVLSNIRTAIVAPLEGANKVFGILQLDIRESSKGIFGKKDLDRVTVFARHLALVLETLRYAQEQSKALESTIHALVHSLFLKDPDTAAHSERVQAITMIVAQYLGMKGTDLEALNAAALLHDLGKQGVHDKVLKKPARLTETEIQHMSHHSKLTETILDKIYYPEHLKSVPLLAAYHHEKMNGTGPYGLSGNDIPTGSKIISIADCFDALISPRVYKKAMTVAASLDILDKGAGKAWDPEVIAAFKACLPEIMTQVYGRPAEEAA
ncbi:MAG: HD domain-containing protein [Candidatus Eisenbacteria bacterium]|uniref:HD domain-containing protein n=1 Tax=Eiseniibacteriota bacterium TaxID=2212470 RepID=A0A7Y2H222_UNCEI|nr:HD domain-containing protein [Candidatus Eisenbacteria bacterium]